MSSLDQRADEIIKAFRARFPNEPAQVGRWICTAASHFARVHTGSSLDAAYALAKHYESEDEAFIAGLPSLILFAKS